MGVWIETDNAFQGTPVGRVTPFVGVWIETGPNQGLGLSQSVTPFVGVWIETICIALLKCLLMSHPSWVCGLKHLQPLTLTRRF